jgi:hypothetical protein
MASKNNDMMSGWVGWVAFAGVMMYLAGIFHMVAGFIALFKDTVYVVGPNNLWALDYTQWGWLHIVWGLLAVWAAGSLVSGKAFGRIAAVLVALSSAVVNMLFIPVYPIWSIMIIVICVLVIYAVVVHGGDLKESK